MKCDVCVTYRAAYIYDGTYLCGNCFVKVFDREHPEHRSKTFNEKVKIARAVRLRPSVIDGGFGYGKYI